MAKNSLNCVNDCKSAKRIRGFVKDNNLRHEQAAGSHEKFYMRNSSGGEDMMTFYNSEEISIGVAAKIFKFVKNHIPFMVLVIGALIISFNLL